MLNTDCFKVLLNKYKLCFHQSPHLSLAVFTFKTCFYYCLTKVDCFKVSFCKWEMNGTECIYCSFEHFVTLFQILLLQLLLGNISLHLGIPKSHWEIQAENRPNCIAPHKKMLNLRKTKTHCG